MSISDRLNLAVLGRSRIASIVEFFKPVTATLGRKLALFVLLGYVLVGVLIATVGLPLPGPYESITADGSVLNLEPPNSTALFGTTTFGYSVLSQTVHSFTTSLLIGFLSAFIVIFLGVNIGLVAGYYGGKIESALMGLTDFVYGLPLYPFAIIVVAVLGRGTLQIAFVLGVVLWRSVARITRSETLTLRERPFVKAARASGTSNLRIMYSHILPNLLPLIIVYFVFGIIWGILLEAGLSFIGLGDPNSISWGIMLHQVFDSAQFTTAWWWTLPPAFALWIFLWSLYIVMRALEENVDKEQRIDA